MERYVWELTHALAALDHPVIVLCEKAYETYSESITVYELGEIFQKPRWLSMLCFSSKVSHWLRRFDHQSWVIHSHERTGVHDVTTFHGPPFVQRKTRFLDILSPRIHAWTFLEKRELCGRHVKVVLPNSNLIEDLLHAYYPCCRSTLASPAYPAVNELFKKITRSKPGKTIGFIGKEWERKGLDVACKVVEALRKRDKNISLLVVGPQARDVKHLFTHWPEGSYELAGWVRTEDALSRIDVLLHPARFEPFGMVIAEANAAGIPCVISAPCGIAPLLTTDMGKVLPLEAEVDLWASALLPYLEKERPSVRPMGLFWPALAARHAVVYSAVLSEKGLSTL